MFDEALRRGFIRLVSLRMPTEDRDELRVVLDEMTDEILTTSDEADSVIGLAVPGWMFIATAPSMACIGLGAL